jgi:hypothetical protein
MPDMTFELRPTPDGKAIGIYCCRIKEGEEEQKAVSWERMPDMFVVPLFYFFCEECAYVPDIREEVVRQLTRLIEIANAAEA